MNAITARYSSMLLADDILSRLPDVTGVRACRCGSEVMHIDEQDGGHRRGGLHQQQSYGPLKSGLYLTNGEALPVKALSLTSFLPV